MRTLSRAVAPRRPFRPRPLAHAMLSSSRAPPPPAATDGPPPDVEAVVLAVHAAPHKAVVYATGGGAQVRRGEGRAGEGRGPGPNTARFC